MWTSKKRRVAPKAAAAPSVVFSQLTPRSPPSKSTSSAFEMPATRISFTKLITNVLPTAAKLEYKLGYRDALYFCITGLEGTKPLMQWHDDKNRASWFVYHHPDPVEKHDLRPNAWNEVTCIVPFPHLWDGVPQTTTFPLLPADADEFKHYHKNKGFRYLLCLDKVKLKEERSLCLFPSLLKSEFHGVRSTIEAYSNRNGIEEVPDIDAKGGLVSGIVIGRSGAFSDGDKHLLRVTDKAGKTNTYQIVLFE